MENKEIWAATEKVLGYEVSSHGRVRHAVKGTIKGTPVARNGYRVVNLWHRNVGTVCTVHELVANAFIGPRPEGWSVNHIDGNKLNNSPDNLEYMSLADNSRHQARTGLGAKGERCGSAKLTEVEARAIRSRARAGERTSHLAREYGVGSPIVSQIKNGTRWAHLD